MLTAMDPIMSHLRRINMNADAGERSIDFLEYCRLLVRAKGDLVHAQRLAGNASQRLQAIIKSAVASGTSSAANWAEPLVQYSQISAGFIASLIGISAFDTLLANGMRKVPLKSRIVVTTTAATASNVNEAAIKPIGQMTFDLAAVDPVKAVCILIATDELMRLSSPSADSIFSAEMRAGVSRATDSIFLNGLYNAVSPIASSGTTATAMVVDLRALLEAVHPLASSRLFFICTPTSARALTLARDGAGPVFPGMRLDGGEVLPGVGCIVSDQLPVSGNSPSDSTALLVDASGLVGGDDGDISVEIARNATVQFQSAPDSPETAATLATSLWQHGQVGLKAERLFGYDIGRSSAVAALSGVSW